MCVIILVLMLIILAAEFFIYLEIGVQCVKLEDQLNILSIKIESIMNTIKEGSTGDSVKQLQKALNLTADGIFGKKTTIAVKEYQSKNGLVSDGIVGDKTWDSLGFGKQIDGCVIYKPLSRHVSEAPERTIQYLAIHFTAGSKSTPGTALNSVYSTFMNREASADFAVDDQDIVQFNPDLANYYCWAVGDKKNKYSSGGQYYGKATNKNTINIEICSTCSPATSENLSTANNTSWSFTESTLNNAIKIAKIIIKKYNISLSNVIRHYDITGKLCPGVVGWNNEAIYVNGKVTKDKSDSSAWEAFKSRLK